MGNSSEIAVEKAKVMCESNDGIIVDYETSDVSNNYFYEQLSQIRHKIKNAALDSGSADANCLAGLLTFANSSRAGPLLTGWARSCALRAPRLRGLV